MKLLGDCRQRLDWVGGEVVFASSKGVETVDAQLEDIPVYLQACTVSSRAGA